jgi:hypothetical protein
MRLEEDVRLPPAVEQGWPSQFHRALSLFLARVSRQVNLMSEGKITGASNALTAAPTTGTLWSVISSATALRPKRGRAALNMSCSAGRVPQPVHPERGSPYVA